MSKLLLRAAIIVDDTGASVCIIAVGDAVGIGKALIGAVIF